LPRLIGLGLKTSRCLFLNFLSGPSIFYGNFKILVWLIPGHIEDI
jgi:hypothetical protein